MTMADAQQINNRVIRALGHPIRLRVLTVLNDRVASPREMAEEFGEPLGNVSYHTRMLVELGAIELVDTQQRRGAIEHYYRAVMRPFLDDEDFKKLPASVRRTLTDTALDIIWRSIADDIRAGLFEQLEDRHVSRTRLVVDEQGWEELSGLLAGVLERALQIEAESAGRLQGSDEDPLTAKLVILGYGGVEKPAPRGRAPSKRAVKAQS